MQTSIESTHELTLAPSPTGPMTLLQHYQICDRAVQVMERCRYGNGFMPSGTIERTTQERDDLRARLELILEVHPELGEMNVIHQRLLSACYEKDRGEPEAMRMLRQKCSALAHEIVDLEQSVDLG